MKCPRDNVEYEEGYLNNHAQNFGKGRSWSIKFASKFGSGPSVTALRCPKCGEIKIYTTENLQK